MTAPAPITILVADDHPLIRAGLEAVVPSESDLQVIAHAGNGEAAVALYRGHRPDVVLIDLRMPVMDGLSAARAILGEFPGARIVVLTTCDGDEHIYRALSAGARDHLLKDMLHTEMLPVIRAVHQGQRGVPTPVAARLAEYVPMSR